MKSRVLLANLLGNNLEKKELAGKNLTHEEFISLYEEVLPNPELSCDYSIVSPKSVKETIIDNEFIKPKTLKQIIDIEKDVYLKDRTCLNYFKQYPIATCPMLWKFFFDQMVNSKNQRIKSKFVVLSTFWTITAILGIVSFLNPIFLIGWVIGINLLWRKSKAFSAPWWKRFEEMVIGTITLSIFLTLVLLIFPIIPIAVMMAVSSLYLREDTDYHYPHY